jgi:hypothetical protein
MNSPQLKAFQQFPLPFTQLTPGVYFDNDLASSPVFHQSGKFLGAEGIGVVGRGNDRQLESHFGICRECYGEGQT